MTVRRLVSVFMIVAAGTAWVASGAAGDGGPSPGISLGGNGVTGPGGRLRYVTVPTERGTLLESIRVRDGHVLRWTVIRGSLLGIPIVANDGTAGGLSRDQQTLLLVSYAGGPGRGATHFAVFDTRRFRIVRTIVLRGAYSFDALAPDASTLYVVQYTSSQDWNRYRVRAYDLVRGRLLAGAVVDKREPAEAMSGAPVTRVSGVDGAWVYTLYARASGIPFIHALDTRDRVAVCIDLPWKSVAPDALRTVRMAISGRGVVLSQRPLGRLAVVDTRTFAVRALRAPVAGG